MSSAAQAAADPLRLRSAAWVRFFGRVMARQMRAHFHAVRVANPGVPAVPSDVPLVVYCNHPSWWDAALMAVLATRVFTDRRSFGPIDAEAIAKYRFMRRIGFFAVQPNSHAGAATLLRVGRDLLSQPDALLWITPEGSFTDPRRRPVSLRPGLASLLMRVPRVVVMPLAVEYPFWTERTPEALLRFGTPFGFTEADDVSASELQRTLENGLTETMDALAYDAMGKDAARFVTLLDGSSAIGGVYDVWRRARAWAHGRRFDPSHEPGSLPGHQVRGRTSAPGVDR